MLVAETVAVELYRSLAEPLAKLKKSDPKLADDARRAVRSIVIVENVAEGADAVGVTPRIIFRSRTEADASCALSWSWPR